MTTTEPFLTVPGDCSYLYVSVKYQPNPTFLYYMSTAGRLGNVAEEAELEPGKKSQQAYTGSCQQTRCPN